MRDVLEFWIQCKCSKWPPSASKHCEAAELLQECIQFLGHSVYKKSRVVYMSIYFWHVTSYHIHGEVPGISRLVPKIMGMGNEYARVYIHCSEHSYWCSTRHERSAAAGHLDTTVLSSYIYLVQHGGTANF